MSVRDSRRAPFCWQSVPALKAIRAGWNPAEGKPSKAHGLGVYRALTEIANESRARTAFNGESEGFEATRRDVAHRAGELSPQTVDRAVRELERLGLLRVERRRAGEVNLPSLYVLVEPGQLVIEQIEGGTPGELPEPQGSKGGSPSIAGVAPQGHTTQEGEEGEEPPVVPRKRGTSRRKRDRDHHNDQVAAWAAEHLPDLHPRAVAEIAHLLRRAGREATPDAIRSYAAERMPSALLEEAAA